MNVGMLWFDNDKKRTLEQKIEKAAGYYEQKYKRKPTVCMVHPGALEGKTRAVINGLQVREWKGIGLHHLWLGIDGQDLASPQPEPAATVKGKEAAKS